MTTRPQIGCALAALSLLTVLDNPNSVLALGIRLPDQDTFATARGNAFVATADDPAAVYYNPAGITQLQGMNASLGVYAITYADRFDGPTTSANSQQQWAALPETFSTLSLTNYHLSLGFGVYSPYGLSMEWPNKVPWAPFGTSGEIDYIRANPVLAYQVTSTLSIAAGVMLDYAQAELENNGSFKLRGRDTDAGFNAGLLWHPWAQHSFGVTYRSATDMNFQGHAAFSGLPAPLPPNLTEAASLNYHFPQTATFGYSYRPTPKWNFEIDADWTDWSRLGTATIATTGPVPAGTLAFNWKQSMIYEFGATHYFDGGWQVSAGYMYSENSSPSSSFNALVPDSDRHLFSLGVGQKFAHLSWNAAYQLGYGPSRNVTGDPQNFGVYKGTYEFFSNAISLNLGYHF